MLHTAIEPLRVLVVEDDPGIGRALSRALRQEGHAFVLVERCHLARELQQSFDVGVLDLELPDGSGVDLGRELLVRGMLETVVFFSATADSALLRRAAEFGEVVPKHGDPSLLIDAVLRSSAAPVSALRVAHGGRVRAASGG
jgi:DNA-binding response OmpR family regulator